MKGFFTKLIKPKFWLTLGVLFFCMWLYFNSLIGVDTATKECLKELKNSLIENQYDPNLFVISGRRFALDNWLLNLFGGAAKNSQHLQGTAIDIIVLDVNNDGISNGKDVDIVYQVLNRKIIKNKGGIGTYKNESGFFNKQMIHFDLRGSRARWHR